MNYRGILKYKIGLLVIGLFTVAMLVVVLVQAGATKQDTQTDKLANSMADSLNGYTDVHFNVPATLREVGITKTSPYISYTRLSASKYKFCVTYKSTSSDFNPSDAVDNVLIGGVSSWDTTGDTGSSDLYIPTSHHKGINCQTVKIDTDNGLGGGWDCGGAPVISGPVSDSSADFVCPLGSGGTGTGKDTSKSSVVSLDPQRSADIDTLQAYLEAYMTSNGYYPTLAELNSASWRSANMKGLEASVLCDPSGGSTSDCQLAAAPKNNTYSYEPTDVNDNDCTESQSCISYTLTATLSTGDQYTDQNQN